MAGSSTGAPVCARIDSLCRVIAGQASGIFPNPAARMMRARSDSCGTCRGVRRSPASQIDVLASHFAPERCEISIGAGRVRLGVDEGVGIGENCAAQIRQVIQFAPAVGEIPFLEIFQTAPRRNPESSSQAETGS